MSSNLKALDLPTNFKFFFLKTDRHGQDKAKAQIQKFLNVSAPDSPVFHSALTPLCFSSFWRTTT